MTWEYAPGNASLEVVDWISSSREIIQSKRSHDDIIQNSHRVGAVQALLTGLVVTTISGSPLEASEHRASDRHVEQSVESSIPRIEGDQSSAALAYHAFAPAPSDRPDGVCDHGDNPMIC